MVIYALVIEISTAVMKSWPLVIVMGHMGNLAFVALFIMNKSIKYYILHLHCYKNTCIAIIY